MFERILDQSFSLFESLTFSYLIPFFMWCRVLKFMTLFMGTLLVFIVRLVLKQKCSDMRAERLRTWWALTGNKDTLSPIRFIKSRWLEWSFRFTTLIKLKFKVKATTETGDQREKTGGGKKTMEIGDYILAGWYGIIY